MELTDEEVPIRSDDIFDKALLNEINDTSQKLVQFNGHLWSLVDRLETELGVRLVNRTRSPAASQPRQEPHPPSDTADSP